MTKTTPSQETTIHFSESYQEILSPSATVVDLCELSTEKIDFAQELIASLSLNKDAKVGFKLIISAKNKLENLFFTAKNNKKIKGYRNIGLGYPLLVKKDRAKVSGFLSAPIFIWDVQLEPDWLTNDSWLIITKATSFPTLNPLLKDLVYGLDEIIEIFHQKTTVSRFSFALCQEFCTAIAAALQFQNKPPISEIYPFPEIEDLATLEEAGAIVWSGFLGTFSEVQPSKLSTTPIQKEYWRESIIHENTPFSFCYLKNSHQEKSAYLASQQFKSIRIEGEVGARIGHTAANHLISQLLNGESTLVISNTLGELEALKDILNAEGFGNYGYLFKNLALDKDILVENIIAKSERILSSNSKTGSKFPKQYSRLLNLKNKLDAVAESYHQIIFDIYGWADTIGFYLLNQQKTDKELLEPLLIANEYAFTLEEYEDIIEQVREGSKQFRSTFAYTSSFDQIADTHFSKEDSKKAKEYLAKQLSTLLKKVKTTQNNSLIKIGRYKTLLENYYRAYFARFDCETERISNLVENLKFQFGETDQKTSINNLKLLKPFSGKSKELLEVKSAIIRQFEALRLDFEAEKNFDFQFLNNYKKGNIEDIEIQLEKFRETLKAWSLGSLSSSQESLNSLSSKTTLSKVGYTQEIEEIEIAIEDLIKEVNAAKLFKESFRNNAMNLPSKLQILDDLADKIGQNLHNLNNFDEYFPWKQFYTSLSNKATKVINALKKVNPQNWEACFNAWYFHNLLVRKGFNSHNFDELLRSFLVEHNLTKKEIPIYIDRLWREKGLEVMYPNNKKDKRKLRTLFKKAQYFKDFKNYFQKHIHSINQFFPIFLMTQESAYRLLSSLEQPIFDNLIALKANNISVEQGSSLLSITRKIQIFGDGRTDSFLNQHSFWKLAKSLSGKFIQLNNNAKSNVFDLKCFIDAAFGQIVIEGIEGHLKEKPILLHSDIGYYNKVAKTNEQEAQLVIDLLKNTPNTRQNTYPKVGVFCATKEQRNLILGRLMMIKRQQTEEAEKIKHLERNGMGVYDFNERGGHQFDTLILSFTYGLESDKKILSQDLETLSQANGILSLQFLLTSTRKNIQVVSSIPHSFIERNKLTKEKIGWYLLANFLEYARQISLENSSGLSSILHRLQDVQVPDLQAEKRPLFEVITTYLSFYFEDDRIQRNKLIFQHSHPLFIESKVDRCLGYIIKVDNYLASTKVFSYTWQVHWEQLLTQKGYKFITTWSDNWWQNPTEEARKLASIIISQEAAQN